MNGISLVFTYNLRTSARIVVVAAKVGGSGGGVEWDDAERNER